jgi:GDP-L-fucose synthase
MRVLLTGGSGMVGRNLLESPLGSAFEVIAPRRADVDLMDRSALLAYLRDARPDAVVHAAATVGGIQANIDEPVRFLAENVQTSLNILTSAREAGVTTFLNIASSCMYPRGRETPLTVEDLLSGPLEPTNEGYALAKILSWKLAEYISREDSSGYKTIVPCNLYGRFDNFDPVRSHLVPAAIMKVSEAVRSGAPEVEIWGDGTARREFMYAGDLANFIWAWLPKLEQLPSVMNVGVGNDHTVADYYRTIAGIVGFEGTFHFDPAKPVGMRRKLLDVREQEALGWRPATDLRTGLAETVAFYSAIRGRSASGRP